MTAELDQVTGGGSGIRRAAASAVGVMFVLSACAQPTEVATSPPSAQVDEPRPSSCCESVATPQATASPSDVRAAFLALMSDPDITYHAETKVEGVFTSHGDETLVTYAIAADVAGRDYSATGSITRTDPSGTRHEYGFESISIGDSTYIRSGTEPWTRVARAAGEEPINPYGALEVDELTFIGKPAKDLFEFNIRTWIGREPASFDDPFGEAAIESFYLGDHSTTVIVDSLGVPQVLSSTYALRTVLDAVPGTAQMVEVYTQVGDPVRIELPSDALKQAARG